jgi:hypothetical protein
MAARRDAWLSLIHVLSLVVLPLDVASTDRKKFRKK